MLPAPKGASTSTPPPSTPLAPSSTTAKSSLITRKISIAPSVGDDIDYDEKGEAGKGSGSVVIEDEGEGQEEKALDPTHEDFDQPRESLNDRGELAHGSPPFY